ncbi:hypothetical protein [Nonomuraea pusilla]|uniref:Hydantoinase/oxoprolinase n=1 Tax=Nonomuraea pusilla TaxID=46177 RepID=A0A1H8FSL8_9ACTN|nr:hypothetical protein [Nonomuraea pusilla]SEN34550.1 hypothetical protein SAMN05660976_07332 [Nonomuraea pusilla]
MEGARIGVRLAAGQARAALVTGAEIRHAACPSHDDRALVRMLRGLARDVPVRSVTWDVSDELDPARAGAPVAAVRVMPRLPVRGLGSGHPSPLLRALLRRQAAVIGGHDVFGVELAALDVRRLLEHADAAHADGTTALAVTATGALGCPGHELAAAVLIRDAFPQLRVSLSHQVGGLGLLDREAATVINAALLGTAGRVVERCARVAARLGASAWFVAGDGGRISAERLRMLPVLGLSATGAAALTGAARLAGVADAVVGLAGADGIAVGHVRDGLPHVATDLPGPGGVRMAVPQASLTPISGAGQAAAAVFALLAEHDQHTAVVAVAVQGPEEPDRAAGRGAARELARAVAARLPSASVLVEPAAELAAIGAACTEPSAWLDTILYAETSEVLARAQAAVEQRALTLVAESGARLGSERVVASRAVPLSFLRSGSYRLLVRAGGRAEDVQPSGEPA